MQPDSPSTSTAADGAEHVPVPSSSRPTPPSSSPPTPPGPSIVATAPGQLRVIKRNGSVVPYDDDKIQVALTKAFLAVEGGTAAASSRVRDVVAKLTSQVSATYQRRMPTGGTIHIEEIQDLVELALMRQGEHKVARDYVLYREERARVRAANAEADDLRATTSGIHVIAADGSRLPLDVARIRTLVVEACQDLDDVDPERIIDDALANMYDGITTKDVSTGLVITARALVEEEPNYTYVAARLLLDELRTEALTFLDVDVDGARGGVAQATQTEMAEIYGRALAAFVDRGVQLELLAPELKRFDVERLGRALKPERDLQFTYLGLQTLYDRYFIHSDDTRFELPQVFFMRVAMGLAIQEDDPEARAIAFYDLLSSFDYMSSTPTLFNAGTMRSQLSSCYLTTVSDDLDGIYSAIRDNALLSKWAGGLGNDWTPVRALGSYIKGTNGKSQGVVPFLKVVNDTAVAVNQGGKRRGAVCSYLETWHLDIEEFLELRKNTGDDRRRTHDMNTANWVPDLFMKRVFEDAQWTLFSPNDVSDLHDFFGAAFEQRYVEYEAKTQSGEIKLYKRVAARELWRKMLSMLFRDRPPLDHLQRHLQSALAAAAHRCGAFVEPMYRDHAEYVERRDRRVQPRLGQPRPTRRGRQAGYQEAQEDGEDRRADARQRHRHQLLRGSAGSNLQHAPSAVGLGIMGFQDALYKQRVPYASEAAVAFADQSMEALSYYAIEASSKLAKERGTYATFEGSLWSQGILPIDSLKRLADQRGPDYLQVDTSTTLNWERLRARVRANGMRNSNVMAIAPTATIANIVGVSQSIEPSYQNLFVKSNLSGEFTVVNPYMVHDLKRLGLWDKVMVNDLKYFDGSLAAVDRAPEELKLLYATAFEVEPRWLVDAASRRQKWIDQAQSLNLYIANASGKKLEVTYQMAWLRGLKTTYYLRALGATSAEKSTIEKPGSSLNAVTAGPSSDEQASAPKPAVRGAPPLELGQPADVPAACSIDDPDCEACQ